MSVGINSVLMRGRQYEYRNTNAPDRGKSLFERVGRADSCQTEKRVENGRLSAYDAYSCMKASIRGGAVSESLGAQACTELEKVENEKYAVSVYKKDGIKNHWSIYDKTSDKYYRFDPQNTTVQVDSETGKRYLVQEDRLGGLMNACGMNAFLENTLKEFMGVDEIKGSCINERFDITINQYTGIASIRKKGAEGNGACMIVDGEEQARKLEELANIYMEKYPSLMTSKEMAMTYAELEIAGYAFRDENGILTIGIGGMGYMNEKEPDKGWGILYSGFDSSIYSKIVGAFSEGAITQGEVGIIEKWEEWLEKKGVEFKASTIKWDMEKALERKADMYHTSVRPGDFMCFEEN